MPYLIETFDKPNSAALRQSVRDKHLEFLDEKKALLLACGAKLDDDSAAGTGSVYIVDLETRAQAENFVKDDPYAVAGLFERTVITRWRKAYLDGKCCL